MAMQSSGQIKWSEIQSTHGGSHPVAISEYYGKYYTSGGSRRATSGIQKASYLFSTSPSVTGGWSGYGAYGSCSVSCGGGTQTRTRSCSSPTSSYGGASCSGSTTDSQSCNTHSCCSTSNITQSFTGGQTYTFPSSECSRSITLALAGGGGGGGGITSGNGNPGGAGGTTTVVHKRGGTTLSTYTASGGAGGSAKSCNYGVFQTSNSGTTRCGSNQVAGDSFNAGGMSGTGGAKGSNGCGGLSSGCNMTNGSSGSGIGAGGAGGGMHAGFPSEYGQSRRYWWEGGDSGGYTAASISMQGGDTLTITIGAGGAGKSVTHPSWANVRRGGRNGSSGGVRISG